LDISTRLPCGCPRTHFGQCTAGGFGLRYALNLPGCSQGRHHHPQARMVLSLQSGFDSRYGERTLGVADSAALFRPAGEDHEDRYTVPTGTLAVLLPDDSETAALRRPFVLQDGAFAGIAAALRREMAGPDAASPLVMEGLALLASSKLLHHQPVGGKGVPRWIAAVRERLEAEFASPPTLADLGRMVQRDAVYVAATFKRVYGGSVGAYVRQQRLWQARRCMDEQPEQALSDLALACGFADQSHFVRHFKHRFGVTPGEYRRRHGVGQGTAAQPA